MSALETTFERRERRVRFALRRLGKGRPRLTVFKSNKQIYAQLIDDSKGVTIAAASTIDTEIKAKIKTGANKESAMLVGKLLAQRALKHKVTDVVFDRGGYMFHGRVKALADAAREAGLKF